MSVAFGATYDYTWMGDRVIQAVHDRIHAQLHQSGQEVVQIAQQLVAVRTGELPQSISYEVQGEGSQQTLEIIAAAPHALFVELGTRNMPAQPYIRPALAVIPRVWGQGVGMNFSAVSSTSGSIRSKKPLTPKQHARVNANKAVSSKLHRGNVKRAKIRVKRVAL